MGIHHSNYIIKAFAAYENEGKLARVCSWLLEDAIEGLNEGVDLDSWYCSHGQLVCCLCKCTGMLTLLLLARPVFNIPGKKSHALRT